MQFTEDHLKVHFGRRFQEDWDDAFVEANARHETPHGQTKLLWSNLLGLALVEGDMQRKRDQRDIQLVVAGASPGTHMLVLLKHLHAWKKRRAVGIHLYDPQPLDAKLLAMVSKKAGITFRRDVFTDADAARWRDCDRSANCVVFFSDIRSEIEGKARHMQRDEDLIEHDMQAQQAWVRTMQPDYCMLKFHARHATKDRPQVDDSFPYLPGVLYEQAYAGLFSAEYRLFCTQADIDKTHDYSTSAIEKHAFFHTKITRPRTYCVKCNKAQYDDAFAAHVAEKAAWLLGFDSDDLLRDARAAQRVAHMHFAWLRMRDMRKRLQN